MIHSADEFVALRSSDDPEIYYQAAHDSASEEVWREVVERYPEMRVWVAHNKSVPLSILELLSTDPDDRVRFMVASKRKLSRELFERMARDPNEGVRMRVACNRKTPPEILRLLLSDPWDEVVQVARRRLEEKG